MGSRAAAGGAGVSLLRGPLALLARRRLRQLRARASDPDAVQRAELSRLFSIAARTAFGVEHDFAKIKTHEDVTRAVPLRDYHAMAPYWERARAGEPNVAWPGLIKHWALSSGTTSGEKFLPVSSETIKGNKKGGWDSIVPYLAQGAGDLFAGKLLFLGGCTEMRREKGAWIGDNTGIMTLHMPAWVRRWHTPGPSIASIPDWERKIEKAARQGLDQDVRMLSGVPSWIVLYCEHVLGAARERNASVESLAEVWPNLSLFVHGGVSFAPYRERFRELAGRDVWCTDTYSASEGGMLAVQDARDEAGMLPLLDQGVFFEFVPANELGSEAPTRLTISQVEPGVDYAVVLHSDSGIWGYLVGDLVRFVSVRPLRLVFAGRIAHTLNAFGEHVSGAELDRAIGAAVDRSGAVLAEFAVATEYPLDGQAEGRHVWYCEFVQAPRNLDEFARAIDETISAGNEDYETHRSYGLRAPIVRRVQSGGFEAWMKQRGKHGGQNKVPRTLAPELEETLRSWADSTA